uniref:Uncharacterized protein n=1 Tax=Anguilla anguilla TaxID=7936 RepID=A0A0E9X8D3_ANGAN
MAERLWTGVGYCLKIFNTDTKTDTFNSIQYLHDTFFDTLYYENLIGLSANYFSINDYTASTIIHWTVTHCVILVLYSSTLK